MQTHTQCISDTRIALSLTKTDIALCSQKRQHIPKHTLDFHSPVQTSPCIPRHAHFSAPPAHTSPCLRSYRRSAPKETHLISLAGHTYRSAPSDKHIAQRPTALTSLFSRWLRSSPIYASLCTRGNNSSPRSSTMIPSLCTQQYPHRLYMTVPSLCISRNTYRLVACAPPRTHHCANGHLEPLDARIILHTTQPPRCASRNTHLFRPLEKHRAASLNLITLSPRRHCALLPPNTHCALSPPRHT